MFRKAQKSLSKARICLAGPAGAGKSYSALLLASGLGQRIAMIDTEHGSGDLYSDVLEYDIVQLSPPFECQKYLDAIKQAEKEDYGVIIIDSLSHAWAGEGGLLDLHTKIANTGKENSYTAWRQVTPLHNALIEAMLQSKCHIIATARSKMEYTIEKDTNGRTTIRKVGLQPVFRDGIEFEFTLFLDLAQDHTAFATKDRTTLFDGKYFKITRETGETIRAWLNANTCPRPGSEDHKPVTTPGSAGGLSPAGQPHQSSGIGEGTAAATTKTQNTKPETLNSKRNNTDPRLESRTGFMRCIEEMKGRIDPDTFKEICKPYEPLSKLHDRAKQVELYNKLRENSRDALLCVSTPH